jgi:MinD-like ATPase involved in chromosome partitioning or flagellar assembly
MAVDPLPAGRVMIRDLRVNPPPLPVSSQSLAFSRSVVERRATTWRKQGRATPHGGFTIAVTAPRLLTCKRGFAAHLAAHLAMRHAADDMSVCVVDADVESRDIGVRFGVSGPVLLDVAKSFGVSASPLDQVIARVDPPGLYVLPTRPPEPALAPLLRSKTPKVFAPLASAFDVVVVDAPVGLGVDTPDQDALILARVDALVVAVTADPAAFGSLLRYLNVLEAAVERGALPSNFDVHIVLTGSDHDGSRTLTEADIERRLEGLPVAGSVPQLWGRGRPDGPLAGYVDSALDDAFDAIVERITAVPQD